MTTSLIERPTTIHRHPKNDDAMVNGIILEPGDVLQAHDVYNATVGMWLKNPLPGQILGAGSTYIWIRPSTSGFRSK
jgi:hypothetical protein